MCAGVAVRAGHCRLELLQRVTHGVRVGGPDGLPGGPLGLDVGGRPQGRPAHPPPQRAGAVGTDGERVGPGRSVDRSRCGAVTGRGLLRPAGGLAGAVWRTGDAVLGAGRVGLRRRLRDMGGGLVPGRVAVRRLFRRTGGQVGPGRVGGRLFRRTGGVRCPPLYGRGLRVRLPCGCGASARRRGAPGLRARRGGREGRARTGRCGPRNLTGERNSPARRRCRPERRAARGCRGTRSSPYGRRDRFRPGGREEPAAAVRLVEPVSPARTKGPAASVSAGAPVAVVAVSRAGSVGFLGSVAEGSGVPEAVAEGRRVPVSRAGSVRSLGLPAAGGGVPVVVPEGRRVPVSRVGSVGFSVSDARGRRGPGGGP